jgi:hypothetical protein
MKVRYSCGFLGFFFWVSLASADVIVNGHVWVKTSVEGKMGYLTGFYDGLREGSLPYEAMKKDIKKSTYEAIQPTIDEYYFPKETSFGDVIKAVDEFYEDYRVLRLPVANALIVARLRLRGASAEAIEKKKEFLLLPIEEQIRSYEKQTRGLTPGK